jgi:hypothetical protein
LWVEASCAARTRKNEITRNVSGPTFGFEEKPRFVDEKMHSTMNLAVYSHGDFGLVLRRRLGLNQLFLVRIPGSAASKIPAKAKNATGPIRAPGALYCKPYCNPE